ncbi:MAG TPA: Spy/CpxP family protein refolding chaperone [Xanthobacteraceae bacterium]|nr:Spy/CpxP family protein refolding chaperone [Xanthobacteraceae bacterium]
MSNLIRVVPLVTVLLLPAAGSAAPHASHASSSRIAQMCSEGTRDVTSLPVDQYRRVDKLSDEQRAALDELAAATIKAAQDIKAACPTEAPPSAPARLAAMQKRVEAMIAAVAAIRPPMEKFYGLLDDEQKEEVIAIGQHQGPRGNLLDQDCGLAQAGVAGWPAAEVERAVHPNDAQRASLEVLEAAVAKAADAAKDSCPSDNLLTPTARLAAVSQRLDALLGSVKAVSGPLGDFYASLDDDQKARFDAISLSHSTQPDQPAKARSATTARRHHFVSIGSLIRRFLHAF